MRYLVGNTVYDSGMTAWDDILPFYTLSDLYQDADEFHNGNVEDAVGFIVDDMILGEDARIGEREELIEVLMAAVYEHAEETAAKWEESQP